MKLRGLRQTEGILTMEESGDTKESVGILSAVVCLSPHAEKECEFDHEPALKPSAWRKRKEKLDHERSNKSVEQRA
jgi:hypothetical protein